MEGKKEVEKINTEDLIHEVENHPAVWDSSIEQYSNKNEKRNAWSEIIMHLIPDFEGKSPAEKNEIGELKTNTYSYVYFFRSSYTTTPSYQHVKRVKPPPPHYHHSHVTTTATHVAPPPPPQSFTYTTTPLHH